LLPNKLVFSSLFLPTLRTQMSTHQQDFKSLI